MKDIKSSKITHRLMSRYKKTEENGIQYAQVYIYLFFFSGSRPLYYFYPTISLSHLSWKTFKCISDDQMLSDNPLLLFHFRNGRFWIRLAFFHFFPRKTIILSLFFLFKVWSELDCELDAYFEHPDTIQPVK